MFTYQQLLSFTENILLAIGHSKKDATLGAKVLLSADLRGVDSHGVARVWGSVRLWEAQRGKATPHIRRVH
ncbi:MAG: Ldh family oxidoreductase, partial [Imperialibacter sp.]